MWISLGLLSACFLGIYDVCKKQAVRENAVLPALFVTTLAGLALMGPVLVISTLQPEWTDALGLTVAPLPWRTHAFLFLKAGIVSASWILAYFSLKHLPISIVTPIRASSPLWTLIGAVTIFGERPNLSQWIGLSVILLSYYAFAVLGRREGISFRRNRWVWAIVGATVIGAASGLYDKCLLQRFSIPPVTVQAWFSAYLVVILGALVAGLWWPNRARYTPFQFRPSMIAVGVLLIAADFAYFRALADPAALLCVLSALRRCSVLLSFALGVMIFRDQNPRAKALALLGVLAGVFLILLG